MGFPNFGPVRASIELLNRYFYLGKSRETSFVEVSSISASEENRQPGPDLDKTGKLIRGQARLCTGTGFNWVEIGLYIF